MYEVSDIMLGIQYVIEKARALNMPVSICIGLGTNQGAHDGSQIIEEYINSFASRKGMCICTAARK